MVWPWAWRLMGRVIRVVVLLLLTVVVGMGMVAVGVLLPVVVLVPLLLRRVVRGRHLRMWLGLGVWRVVGGGRGRGTGALPRPLWIRGMGGGVPGRVACVEGRIRTIWRRGGRLGMDRLGLRSEEWRD